MTTIMPQDIDGHPIPAVRLKEGGAHTISTGASSARNITAFDPETRIVSLYATEPVYIRFGASGVDATSSDHYFPAGTYYDVSIGGDKATHYTHIAALAVNTAGTLYISEKE
ncbi:MAG: hypothetical protein QF692_03095 [Alphaproteobacteria bacterium]|jgi:hypothetical protein|nr:hypothetical protein [Alphaproteobacteria bacterium]MDP7222229.1 hypothetical protein [Alphaproteobacteria bacterium]